MSASSREAMFEPVSLDQWRDHVDQAHGAGSAQRLSTEGLDGLTLAPLYGPGAVSLEVPERLASRWKICQEYDSRDRFECNRRLRNDHALGSEVAWIHLGRNRGVAVQTAAELGDVLAGMDLRTLEVFLDGAEDAWGAAAQWLAVADRVGVPTSELRGSFCLDPLATLLQRGSLPQGLRGMWMGLADLGHWTLAHAPQVRSTLVSTEVYHAAGATAVQEVAFAVATGLEYLRRLSQAGLTAEQASSQMVFSLSAAGEFLVQIGKLRAFRWLWSRVLGVSGARESLPDGCLHVRAGRRAFRKQAPWMNLCRGTSDTLAAVFGGADLVTTERFALEPSGVDDPTARRLARNTQLILAYEAGVGSDAVKGSWCIEQITYDLAKKAWQAVQEIERTGGMTAKILRGEVATEIGMARALREEARARGDESLCEDGEQGQSNAEFVPDEQLSGTIRPPPAAPPEDSKEEALRTQELMILAAAVSSRNTAAGVRTAAALRAARRNATLEEIRGALCTRLASLHVDPLLPLSADTSAEGDTEEGG